MGNGGIDSHIVNLGSRWNWVVKFHTPITLTPRKEPRYPLARRLSGHSAEQENLLPHPVIETRFLCRIARIDWDTSAWIAISGWYLDIGLERVTMGATRGSNLSRRNGYHDRVFLVLFSSSTQISVLRKIRWKPPKSKLLFIHYRSLQRDVIWITDYVAD
jgi:hypothetical protein